VILAFIRWSKLHNLLNKLISS